MLVEDDNQLMRFNLIGSKSKWTSQYIFSCARSVAGTISIRHFGLVRIDRGPAAKIARRLPIALKHGIVVLISRKGKPMYKRRDYYWRQVAGWWEVWTEIDGNHFRVGDFRFWRERTAAQVANEIFAAYHNGRDAGRARSQTAEEIADVLVATSMC
jgi:hypothetical protein